MTKEEFGKRLFVLNAEIQLRCGDGGGGKITSHSINCRCQELGSKIADLMNEYTGLMKSPTQKED